MWMRTCLDASAQGLSWPVHRPFLGWEYTATTRRYTVKRKIALIGALVVAFGAPGGGLALASGGAGSADADGSGDVDVPISGADLGPAMEAALAQTGEGKVTETEVGDEESYYEVEVTLDDGSQVDVQLDRDFAHVGTEAEGDGPDDKDGSGR